MKKYLTVLYSAVDSITNLARRSSTFEIVSKAARSQATNRLKGYLHLADQIKQLEETNQELESQVKLRDRLLSIISHDTRAPLDSLKSLLYLVSSKHLTPDELQEVTSKLNLQVRQLSRFLDNLLQWTKNHYNQINPNRENLLLRPLVLEAINLLSLSASNKRVHIHCFITESETIHSDAEMIRIIMRNLISNAIKFSYVNGSVFIESHQMPGGVIISVRDTGQGISKENLERLFQFSNLSTSGTADEVGTGLGLTLCREFVEKLGGIIQVTSEEGKGSCFEFTVPHVLKEQISHRVR
jgi:signal transduction histidine kinase